MSHGLVEGQPGLALGGAVGRGAVILGPDPRIGFQGRKLVDLRMGRRAIFLRG